MSFKDERKLPPAGIGTPSRRPPRALGTVAQVLVQLGSRGMATMPSREPLHQGSRGGTLEAVP